MKKPLLLILLSGLFVTTAMALNPSRTFKQKPDSTSYTEAKVTTEDGAKINIRDFPCSTKKSTALLLICHNGEGNMGDYLERVDSLRKRYNLAIFDYRGFGESSEFEIDNNMYISAFSERCASCIRLLRKDAFRNL